jgi:hypothetical protein
MRFAHLFARARRVRSAWRYGVGSAFSNILSALPIEARHMPNANHPVMKTPRKGDWRLKISESRVHMIGLAH